MPNEVIKQRIRYLIEHGEVHPAAASTRHIWLAIAALFVLNVMQCVEIWLCN